MKTANDILNKKLKDYTKMIIFKRLKNYYPKTHFSFIFFEWIIIITDSELGLNLTIFNFLLMLRFKKKKRALNIFAVIKRFFCKHKINLTGTGHINDCPKCGKQWF